MLYFIESFGYYKIGYTKNLEKRMSSYSSMNPNFTLIGVREGDTNDEKMFHCYLKKYRIKMTEWFKGIDDEIIKELTLLFTKNKNKKFIYETTISYKNTLIDFYNKKNEIEKKQYYDIYPEFEEYNKYLTYSEIHSVQYNKEKLLKIINDKKKLPIIIDRSLKIGFMPASEIKQRLKEEFEKEGITITPKASLVEKSDNYTATLLNKLYNGKVVKGYSISYKENN